MDGAVAAGWPRAHSGPPGIDSEARHRIVEAAGHRDLSCEVEYLIDRLDCLADGIGVANIRFEQGNSTTIAAAKPLIVMLATSMAQIVEDQNLGPLACKPVRQIGSDGAAAGNQN